MSPRQRRRQRRRGGGLGKIFLAAVAVLLVCIAAVAIAGGSWVINTCNDAPDVNNLKPIFKGENSIVFAGDNSRLGYIRSDEARTPVPLSTIPKDLQFATVAIEDERFFDHNGIDYEGGLRAFVENIEAGEVVQGGSTLTMQLMRNLYITDPQRTFDRKVTEACMAVDYEEEHTKNQVLSQYLNSASYGTLEGRTSVGVEAAARTYFSASVDELTLEQSALLAGLPQAPSEYNPFLNPTGAKERRNEVLKRMADLGYISQRRARNGQQAGLQLNRSDIYSEIREPLFFDFVQNELIERYGVARVRKGGLKVYTTIDPDQQEIAREAMATELPYSTDPSSAVVSIDPKTGFIEAMASSASYDDLQYNLAAQGKRQPGSTFKTFVLTAAINSGIDPYSTYYTSMPLELDLPEWGHWSVSTYSGGYSGSMDIASATIASDNTVFAQLDLDVGPDEVAETAKKMGIQTELDGIPAEGLGGLRIGVSPLEMASAYATLADGGIYRKPTAIRKVVFPDGRISHPTQDEPKRVLPENVAYEVTQILHDNMTSGTGTAAYTGCYGQAGKTGTTDNYTDAWFVGYQPNVSTAVWVGYPESNEISMTSVQGVTVAGGTFPAEIWYRFTTGTGTPCEDFPVPEEPIEWSQYFGEYSSSYDTDSSYDDEAYVPDDTTYEEPSAEGGGTTYDPDLYAPGAGQEPAPPPTVPAPAPTPPATPAPSVTPGGAVGPG